MRKTAIFFLIFLCFNISLSSIRRVHANPDTETLYVIGFNSVLEEWDETGASPWLNDNTGNEVSTSVDEEWHEEFTFADSSGSGTINSVKLYIEVNGPSGRNDEFHARIWTGTSWKLEIMVDPDGDDYLWYWAELSSIVNTWSEIDGAKLKIQFRRAGSPKTEKIYVRRAYLYVDYTPEQVDPLSDPDGAPGPDEGYGEANENLGQFTDTFINETYVTVLSDVIVNTTLECVELEAAPGGKALEDFSTYTEVDIGADRITFPTDYHIDHTAQRDEETYVYEDFGADYFDDFTHDFDFESEYDQVGGLGNPYVLTQTSIDDVYGSFLKASEKTIDIRLYRHGSIGNQFILYYFSGGGGVGDSDTWNGPTSNVRYYVRIVKAGSILNLGVYSTANLRDVGDATDGDVMNLDLNLGSDLKFRYIYPVATWNDGNNLNMNYEVYDLWIGAMGEGYNTKGYFLTEDYLNYTTGNSLNLLTNSSLPENTGITVEFSLDNSTWVDNHGNVGFSTVEAGFFAIDLRDLNYSDIFMRYNFTGDGNVTPRLYQSRIVTTNGTAGGAPGPGVTVVESDAPWIALAIILSIIAFLLATRIKR